MSTIYDRLVAAGVPPEEAAKAIVRQMAKIGETQTSIQPTAEDLTGSLETKRKRPYKVRWKAKSRMLAHVLLNRAYRQGTEPSRIPLLKLFSYMKKAFDAYSKEFPNETFLEPSLNSLQNELSNLRNGKLRGLPMIQTQGPLTRRINGQPVTFIVIEPRNEIQDFIDGWVLPDWVWDSCKMENREETG